MFIQINFVISVPLFWVEGESLWNQSFKVHFREKAENSLMDYLWGITLGEAQSTSCFWYLLECQWAYFEAALLRPISTEIILLNFDCAGIQPHYFFSICIFPHKPGLSWKYATVWCSPFSILTSPSTWNDEMQWVSRGSFTSHGTWVRHLLQESAASASAT